MRDIPARSGAADRVAHSFHGLAGGLGTAVFSGSRLAPSDRVPVTLAGPDPLHALHVADPDLAVADDAAAD